MNYNILDSLKFLCFSFPVPLVGPSEALTSPSLDLPSKTYRSPSLRFELEKKFERDLWVSLTNSQSSLLNNYLFPFQWITVLASLYSLRYGPNNGPFTQHLSVTQDLTDMWRSTFEIRAVQLRFNCSRHLYEEREVLSKSCPVFFFVHAQKQSGVM